MLYILSILRLHFFNAMHFSLSKYLFMQSSGLQPKEGSQETWMLPHILLLFFNVKVISPLSSLYWGTETVYASVQSPRDLTRITHIPYDSYPTEGA